MATVARILRPALGDGVRADEDLVKIFLLETSKMDKRQTDLSPADRLISALAAPLCGQPVVRSDPS